MAVVCSSSRFRRPGRLPTTRCLSTSPRTGATIRLDEPARRSLYDALADAIGDGQADTLMNLLPAHPLADMATRDDVNSLAIAVRGEMAELRGELRGEMALGFGAVDRQFGEIRGEMAELRGEMAETRGEIGNLSGDLRAEFSRQILTLGLLPGSMMIAVLGTVLSLGLTGAFA